MIQWVGRVLATATALYLWGPVGAAFSLGIILSTWTRSD